MNSSIRSNRRFNALCYITLLIAMTILIFTVVLSLMNTNQSCSSMYACQHQLNQNHNAQIVLIEYPSVAATPTKNNSLNHIIQNGYYIGIYLLAGLTVLLCFLSFKHHAIFSRPVVVPTIIALLLGAQFALGIWSVQWQSITAALIIHFVFAIAITAILWLLVLISSQKPRAYNFHLKKLRPYTYFGLFICLCYIIISLWRTLHLINPSYIDIEQSFINFHTTMLLAIDHYLTIIMLTYTLGFAFFLMLNKQCYSLNSTAINLCVLSLASYTCKFFINQMHVPLYMFAFHTILITLLIMSFTTLLFKLYAIPWEKIEVSF